MAILIRITLWGVQLSFQAYFDLDIPKAIHRQLLEVFENLDTEPLRDAYVGGPLDISDQSGVYGLFLLDELVYVGKAGNLQGRIARHRTKIEARQHITLDETRFKCVTVHPNWNAFAPEHILRNHYNSLGLNTWDRSSFGSNDPGRERETTNMPPEGWDQRYPIQPDYPCDWIEEGDYALLDLLVAIKSNLPFLLRYGVDRHYRTGHSDFADKTVHVPAPSLPVTDLLRRVVAELPGWQATRFPSHMILYPEDRDYTHGVVIAVNRGSANDAHSHNESPE